MSAYVVVEVEILDAAAFDRYRVMVPPTVEAYGGRYLARGGRTEVLEGDWSPPRLVVLEFPSLERARAWLSSPEYAPAKAIRKDAARFKMVAVEGV